MVESLQFEARKRHDVTMDSLSKRLDESFEIAKAQENSGQMTASVMGQAKLHGLLVDRSQQLEPRADDMTPDALAEELERLQAELDALDAGPTVVEIGKAG